MGRQPVYLAIDVGTGSVRVALFTSEGTKIAYAAKAISTRNPKPDFYEQSTQDIWRSTLHCVHAVGDILSKEEHKDKYIGSIGIDATCSLVACRDDEKLSPLSIRANDDSKDNKQDENEDIYNVILWLDRRAIQEAAQINAMDHGAVRSVVNHFGGIMSPENEPPKLLWLGRHRPEVVRDGLFFDLADWLAIALTGQRDVRSSCTTACKWGWGGVSSGQWSEAFWQALSLDALIVDGCRKIGSRVLYAGSTLGRVTREVAQALKVSAECIVAAPMIDAYAGCLWSLGLDACDTSTWQRLNMVCGTSTCFLQISPEAIFVNGVWGPFADAIVRGMHVTEGGQSVTGKLLENTIQRHASYEALKRDVGEDGVYNALTKMTEDMLGDTKVDPATNVHCLDYHAGNRSPLADPSLKGSFVGLTLSTDTLDLAIKFRATVQALCYGARHVMEEMRKAGHDMRVIAACGGLCQSRLFLTELADCVSMPVLLCKESDTVLLGGAILAKMARVIDNNDEDNPDYVGYMMKTAKEMSVAGEIIKPNTKRSDFHDRKYRVYRKLHSDYLEYRRMMNTPTVDERGEDEKNC